MAASVRFGTPLCVTLKGLGAGLVGTLVMTSMLRVVGRVLARFEPEAEDPWERVDGWDVDAYDEPDPADEPPAPPTEQVAARIARTIFRRDLSTPTRQRIGVVIHWLYGIFWGALSAQLQHRVRLPAVPYGIALGLVLWMVGPARIVPALRLQSRRPANGLGRRALSVALHVLYGLTTAVTLDRLIGRR